MRAIIGQTKTAVQPTGLYYKIWQRWSKVFINVGLLIVFSYVLHILLNLHFFFLYYISEFKCVVKLLHTDRKRGFTNLASLKYVFFLSSFPSGQLSSDFLPVCESQPIRHFKAQVGEGSTHTQNYVLLRLLSMTSYIAKRRKTVLNWVMKKSL